MEVLSSLEIHTRKLQSLDETGWLWSLLVAHRLQSSMGCVEAHQLSQTAKAAPRCRAFELQIIKMTVLRGLEGSVLQQGGWSGAGAVLEMEKTGWKGAWHVVQGTAMTEGGGVGVHRVAEAPSPAGKCLGSVTSPPGNAASVGHVAVCRASLKMGSHPFCS